MSRTSADITKTANELQAKLEKLRKEARRMKKQEEQQAEEERRQQEIADALEFVKYAKMVFYPGSEESVYDYLSHCLEDLKSGSCTWGYTLDDESAGNDVL